MEASKSPPPASGGVCAALYSALGRSLLMFFIIGAADVIHLVTWEKTAQQEDFFIFSLVTRINLTTFATPRRPWRPPSRPPGERNI